MLESNPCTVSVCKFSDFLYLSFILLVGIYLTDSCLSTARSSVIYAHFLSNEGEGKREREQVCTISLLLIHLDFSVVSYFSTIVPPVLDQEG